MDKLTTFQDAVETTEKTRRDFFRIVFANGKGLVCIAYKSPLDTSMSEEYWEYPNQLDAMLNSITERAKTLTHIYFCPQLLKSRKRVKGNVEPCSTLWADLDTCNPQLLQVPPSIIVQSSQGRWQAFWRLEDPLPPLEAESICRKIAYFHASQGADKSGWDLTQLLRVPYTPNYKYGDLGTAPLVVVLKTNLGMYRPKDFECYPEYIALVQASTPLPDIVDLPNELPTDIMQRYRMTLNPQAFGLYSQRPTGDDDWSAIQWKLEKFCTEAGMTIEEVFVIVKNSSCNKYRRDRRSDNELWREVQKSFVKELEEHNLVPTPTAVIPDFLTDEEVRLVQSNETFVERYIKWAMDITDAAPQYHQAGAFILLSSIISGTVRLPTSFGTIMPNMWFMLLADTAQPLHYPILTPNGWRKMGELELFDEVIGSDGKPTKVIGIQERGIIDNYRVTLNDGSTVECSNDHLWTTKLYTGNYINTVPLSKIREALRSGYNPRIPTLKGNERIGWKSIKKVKYIGDAEMRCILVSNADGLYVTNDYIITHNTLTRKSTTMRIAMDLLKTVSPDAIMATDGSAEGILTALSKRGKEPSVYLRDEFTGLLETISHRDYMAGFAEHLTKLYDGETIKRILRKEEIRVDEPVFIIYAGGIKSKTQMLLTDEHINSGFVPRFVFITAEPDPARVRPVGPPRPVETKGRSVLRSELFDIYNFYNHKRLIVFADGSEGYIRPEFEAELTEQAWRRYNAFEANMTKAAVDTGLWHLTAVNDRLAKSTLKAAILIAASRQRASSGVKIELEDLLHAMYYAKFWHAYSSEIVNGIGKSNDERLMDQIMIFIAKSGQLGVTRSEIMRKFSLDAKKAELVFSTIHQRRLVIVTQYKGQPRYIGAT